MTDRKPLRLWPGLVMAAVLVLLRYVVPFVAGDAMLFSFPVAVIGIGGGVALAAAIVVWWLFFSRAPWPERVGAVVLMVVAFFLTRLAADQSVSRGMMGAMLILYAVPLMGVALVLWAAATQRLADGPRRVALVVAIALACVPWTLVRSAGILGAGAEIHARWTPTPEERLLSQETEEPAPVRRAESGRGTGRTRPNCDDRSIYGRQGGAVHARRTRRE